MKSKLFILSALAMVVAISVSGCGLYNVNKSHSKGFINSKNIAGIKDGVSEYYILSKFGKPSSKKEKIVNNTVGSVWAYCGKKVRNKGYLYVFHSRKIVNRCAFFTFDDSGKLVKTSFKNY